MHVVVDTNVPKTANGDETPQASVTCVAACALKLDEIRSSHVLVVDDGWRILKEYMGQLSSDGQPGAGDDFLAWILINRTNPHHCIQIPITPTADGYSFAEFPHDPALAGFDPSDHKFVAVALAHPQTPPILNATDSDWWHHHAALTAHNLRIEYLCPDVIPGTISPSSIS